MRNKNFFIFLPIIVGVIFILSEWWMWAFTPYSFFYHRGASVANLDYETITRGDLVAGNIFVTPVPRKCRYKTDQFGERNEDMPQRADIVIMGDSFAYGGGNSHEDTPAVQLSKLTGKVCVVARGSEMLTNISGMERAALLMKWQRPTQFNKMLYFILDADLLEPMLEDPTPKVKDIFESNIDHTQLSWEQKFKHFKKYVADYSPQAIIARKLKTNISMKSFSFLHRLGLIRRSSRTIDFLDHNGKVYGFMKMPADVNEFSKDNTTLLRTVNALGALHDYAGKNHIEFAVVVIPRKKFAYNRFIPSAVRVKGYGPGELLYENLEKRGIPTVFLHPAMYKAVEQEIERGGPAVYWSDDTHWGPYGIHVSMEKVKEKLLELKWL